MPWTVPLVTGIADKHRWARAIALAVGPALPAPDGSLNAAENLSRGEAIADVEDTLETLIAQAFPATVTDMLEVWETAFGLSHRPDLTEAQRQTRLAARVRARVAGTKQAILTAVQTLVSTSLLHELTTVAASVPDPRNVFRIGIELNSEAGYALYAADIDAIVQSAKPAHVAAVVGVTYDFLTDDSSSLTDRDFLAV